MSNALEALLADLDHVFFDEFLDDGNHQALVLLGNFPPLLARLWTSLVAVIGSQLLVLVVESFGDPLRVVQF
jgi:hypothetical protein